jgi:hypothetical protein
MSEESLSESSEEPMFHIIEKYMEDEDPIIVEQICINDESVNIEVDNIYFTITEEQYDIFVCTYCDTSFFTQNDYYNHEKTCVDNHSIIDSEQNTDELKSVSLSEIEGSVDELLYDNNELIIYEPQSVLDKYCNVTMADLKCEFCIRSIPSYCNCDMRFRLYRLALDICELKKGITEFSIKTSKLLEETQALRLKYCCYDTYHIRGSIYYGK